MLGNLLVEMTLDIKAFIGLMLSRDQGGAVPKHLSGENRLQRGKRCTVRSRLGSGEGDDEFDGLRSEIFVDSRPS